MIIDGQDYGELDSQGRWIELPPGSHTVEARHGEAAVDRRQIQLHPGQVEVIVPTFAVAALSAPPAVDAGQVAASGAAQKRAPQGSRVVPAISTGAATVIGSLSKEQIRRHIRLNINQIRYCYEQQLAQRPDLGGRVQIRFVISPSGAVTSSSVAGSTLGSPPAEQCIARAVHAIRFPPPEGGGVVIVTYPFMFQTDSSSGGSRSGSSPIPANPY